jgi:hypothetical protein
LQQNLKKEKAKTPVNVPTINYSTPESTPLQQGHFFLFFSFFFPANCLLLGNLKKSRVMTHTKDFWEKKMCTKVAKFEGNFFSETTIFRE